MNVRSAEEQARAERAWALRPEPIRNGQTFHGPAHEQMLINELYQHIERLEQRIEALEAERAERKRLDAQLP